MRLNMSLTKHRRRYGIEEMEYAEDATVLRNTKLKLQVPKNIDFEFERLLNEIIKTSRKEQIKLQNE